MALNRVISNSATSILGQLEANGQLILINPNGVLFGESAKVDVGGLIASGLNLQTRDFLNGDYVFKEVGGSAGMSTVINRGIINAATGGHVTLLGKRVANEGLINAQLGSIALAAGREIVLTFDEQNLIGVRVAKETLQRRLGITPAISNSGEIIGSGSKVLLTAQTSRDLFSEAVNHEGLLGSIDVQTHEDGSFTLGTGANVVNTGTIDVSSNTTDAAQSEYDLGQAGNVTLVGSDVQHSGAIKALNHSDAFEAENPTENQGVVRLQSSGRVWVRNGGSIDVSSPVYDRSAGHVSLLGRQVGLTEKSWIAADAAAIAGSVQLGGALSDYVLVGKDVSVTASGAYSQDPYGGNGGEITIHGNRGVLVDGRLSVRGPFGGPGGDISITSGGALGFNGTSSSMGGNIHNEEHASPGLLYINAPNLTIRKGYAQDSISERALSSGVAGAHVVLETTGNVRAEGEPATITPYRSLTVSATGPKSMIDLNNLIIDPGESYERTDLVPISLTANGDIISPEIGVNRRGEDNSPRQINVYLASNHGDIKHRKDVFTYTGDYSAQAAGNIIFEGDATLHTHFIPFFGRGYTDLISGGEINLRLSTLSYGDESERPMLTLKGKTVSVWADMAIPSAEIVASDLFIWSGDDVSANATVRGTTRLDFTPSEPSGGTWRLSGDFNTVSIDGTDGHFRGPAGKRVEFSHFDCNPLIFIDLIN